MANELKKILNYSANDIDNLLQNGVYAVGTEEERDSLSLSIKTTNRVVYVKNTGEMYHWVNDSWVKINQSGGIVHLEGTASKPVNFAADMEVGNAYIISGYIYKTASTKQNIARPAFVFKSTAEEALVLGVGFDGTSNTSYGSDTKSKVSFDKNTGIWTSSTSCYASIKKINGAVSVANIYVPTSSGAQGQILQSNGSSAPTWTDPAAAGLATIANIEAAIGNVSSLLGNTDDLEV